MVSKIFGWVMLVLTLIVMLYTVFDTTGQYTFGTILYFLALVFINIKYVEGLK